MPAKRTPKAAHSQRAMTPQRSPLTASGRYQHCFVPGCKRVPCAPSEGRLGRFCKQHDYHYARHGSPFLKSYPAKRTNPFRRAALSWLWQNNPAHHQWVDHARGQIELRLQEAGQPVAANSLRGLKPDAKARAVWARLRQGGVPVEFIVAAIVGVRLCFERDEARPSGRWGTEYRRVQIAKVLNRMAGGDVKRWASAPRVMDDVTGRKARPKPQELRAFVPSSGRVLRFIGAQAEEACGWIIAECMDDVRAVYDEQPKNKAVEKTPWPDRHRARPKPRIPDDIRATGEFAQRAERERLQRLAADRQRRDAQRKAAQREASVKPARVVTMKGGKVVSVKKKPVR